MKTRPDLNFEGLGDLNLRGSWLVIPFENARKTLKTVRNVLFEKTRGNGAKNGAPRHFPAEA